MPKFKPGDKIKIRNNVQSICKELGAAYQSCWKDAISDRGKIVGAYEADKIGPRWNTQFQSRGSNMWIYECMIELVDENDDCMVNTAPIHKLLDRLIKGT